VAYQIANPSLVYDWLAQEPSAARREAFLAWLPVLASDPDSDDALPVPGFPLTRVRPVPECRLLVTYLVAEQFMAVNIISIADL
jgi:hypothetical protein